MVANRCCQCPVQKLFPPCFESQHCISCMRIGILNVCLTNQWYCGGQWTHIERGKYCAWCLFVRLCLCKPLRLLLSLRWLLSKPDWSSSAIYSCRKLTCLHRFYLSYQSWVRPSLYQKKVVFEEKNLLNGISIQFYMMKCRTHFVEKYTWIWFFEIICFIQY